MFLIAAARTRAHTPAVSPDVVGAHWAVTILDFHNSNPQLGRLSGSHTPDSLHCCIHSDRAAWNAMPPPVCQCTPYSRPHPGGSGSAVPSPDPGRPTLCQHWAPGKEMDKAHTHCPQGAQHLVQQTHRWRDHFESNEEGAVKEVDAGC